MYKMEYIMQSQILQELKLLSCEVVAIKEELSLLSSQLFHHESSCHSSNCSLQSPVQTYITNEGNRTPTENLEHKITDAHAPLSKDGTLDKSPCCKCYRSSLLIKSQIKDKNTRKSLASEHGTLSSNKGNADISTDVSGKDTQCLRRKCSKEIKHECLRKSLQQNIVLLVDNLSCSEAEIIDNLIQSDCLTETESSDLKRNESRKDCARNLIRLVRGRSYNVLKNFVKCVENLHPEVAESIKQVYDKLMKDRKNYIKRCTFCDLKNSDSIKMVADHLWGIAAISDSLYDDIVSENGRREELWEKLAEEVNRANVRQNALKKISDVLTERGHYKELSLKLSKMSLLKCTCFNAKSAMNTESQLTLNIVVTDVDEMSTVSPVSTPTSSLSLVDEQESSFLADDNTPANKHENYFLSPRAAVRDKQDSTLGLRKSLTFNQNTIAVEFRTTRSNSFGKSSNIRGRSQALPNRRASMYI